MANLFIFNQDGSKTAVTKEQLITLVQSGRLTPDSQIEILGRVVKVSKVRELKPYLNAANGVGSETTPPPQAPEPAPPLATSVPETSQTSFAETDFSDIIPPITPSTNNASSNAPPPNFIQDAPSTSFAPSAPPAVAPKIPIAFDFGLEASSFVDTKTVRDITRRRLGAAWYLYWIPIALSCVTLVSYGIKDVVSYINVFRVFAFWEATKIFLIHFGTFIAAVLAAGLEFIIARWVYEFFTMILVDNPVRRELYHAEQIKVQRELVDLLKSISK